VTVARHALAWLVLWTLAFWLWLLLAGDWNRIEVIAAASGAAVAATVGELARTRAGVRASVPTEWLAKAASAAAMIPIDFAILVWALARTLARRPVEGRFAAHHFPAGGTDPRSLGIRAWSNYVADWSPNSYVVDIDLERQLVLVHDLVPLRASEKPA
jgi:hypothetical protein